MNDRKNTIVTNIVCPKCLKRLNKSLESNPILDLKMSISNMFPVIKPKKIYIRTAIIYFSVNV